MPRGRPRKYRNEDEAAEAARQLRQQRYQRQSQTQAPPEFIAYAPAPLGVPTITQLDLGLRISADIPIPRDPLIQPDELPEDEDAYRPPSPLAPLVVDDIDAAAVISQFRASKNEPINERTEYEQRILQQINDTDARTAGILLEMQAGIAQVRTSADTIPEHLGEDAERPVEPPAANTHSVSHTPTPTPAKAANASAAALNSPQTPSQRSSISSARSSTRGGQRKTFPAQSNTLLSWVTLTSRQPSESPSHSTPQPLPLSSNHSITRLPRLSNSNSTRQPAARGTPAAASPSPSTRCGHVPSLGAAQAAPPAQSTPRAGSSPTPPTERTAYKLAKQLRNFHGCTHEEHAEADRRHQERHQRPNVHSACSSLEEITRLLRGVHNGGTPLPDVLSNPKLMKPSALPKGLDLKAVFKGTSPTAFSEDVSTPNKKLPRNLCLQQHHHSSRKGRAAKVRFNIDSVCCFPSSLAFARNGIDWHPRAHPILNLGADIHFSLTVSAYNNRGDLATRNLPLHKIPHYCFGSITGSTKSLLIFIFFPELHLESRYEHTTYLSKQDQQL